MKGTDMKYLLLIVLLVVILVTAGCISGNQNTPVTPTQTTINAAITSNPQISLSETQSNIQTSSGTLKVYFIDVGQGDSELIQTPSGKSMLIDAGDTNKGDVVTSLLRNKGVSSLDVVVASHPHEDHIGGMATVLNTLPVKQFIDSGYPHTTSTYENMLTLIDKKNIPFRTVTVGDTISLDPAVTINVLHPKDSFSTDINTNSVVIKMTYGKITFLFMGDATSGAESSVASTAQKIDILKVAHHGSSTSSGSSFVSVVRPAVSIIEVGSGNSYGHPAATTIQRLQSVGSQIYRTDIDGTILVTTDGNTYQVTTEKSHNYQPIVSSTASSYTSSAVSGVCDCSGNIYNCADFSTHDAAQSCYEYCISQGKGDIHRLDGDSDGQACESSSSSSSSAPTSAITYQTTTSPASSGGGSCPSGKCWVNGYYRKSGTYVNGYCRSC